MDSIQLSDFNKMNTNKIKKETMYIDTKLEQDVDVTINTDVEDKILRDLGLL